MFLNHEKRSTFPCTAMTFLQPPRVAGGVSARWSRRTEHPGGSCGGSGDDFWGFWNHRHPYFVVGWKSFLKPRDIRRFWPGFCGIDCEHWEIQLGHVLPQDLKKQPARQQLHIRSIRYSLSSGDVMGYSTRTWDIKFGLLQRYHLSESNHLKSTKYRIIQNLYDHVDPNIVYRIDIFGVWVAAHHAVSRMVMVPCSVFFDDSVCLTDCRFC